MDITIGYTIAKPVVTQAECDAYAAMAQAVNDHNAACAVGDTLWTIKDGTDGYTVAADGVVREPTAAELAAQEQARKDAEARAKLPETVAALQSAQSDTDAMVVDHEYRMAMLELGLSE